MSKGRWLKILICIPVLGWVILTSCKAKKPLQKPKEEVQAQVPADDTVADKCRLDYKSGKTLTRLMKEKELDFKTAVAKFTCELKTDEDENSFNVSVRCRKDSVIWMNVSKVGVDALRLLITRDTVKLMIMTNMGALDKGYFIGDFSYINQHLNADLDFDVIQALLFGNSAEFLTDSIKLKGGKDKNNCQYFLSTIRKRRLQRMIEGQPPRESVQTMWLSPETFKIVMLEYDDAETKRKFNACYEDFQLVDSTMMAPFKLLYTITAKKTIRAEIKYSRIKLNDETSFPFKIPESYPPIEIKSKGEEEGKKPGN